MRKQSKKTGELQSRMNTLANVKLLKHIGLSEIWS